MSAAREFAEITVVTEPSAEAPKPERDLIEKSVSDMQPVGLKLAAARRAKGLSMQDVAAGVKIKITHLAAIESGDRAALPAVPFTAGFIKAYAQFLGLDPEEYAGAYRREVGEVAPQADAPLPAQQWEAPAAPKRETRDVPGKERLASYIGIGAAAVCLAVILVGLRPREVTEEPPVAVEEAVPVSGAIEPAPERSSSVPTGDPAGEQPVQEQPGLEEAPAAANVDQGAFEEAVSDAAPAETKEAAAPSLKPERKRRPAMPPANEPALPDAAVDEQADGGVYWETPRSELAGEPQANEAPGDVSTLRAEVAALNARQAEAPTVEASSLMAPVEPAPAPLETRASIVPARILEAPAPLYPERCATRARPTESVDVIFNITPRGRPVGAIVVASSNSCFNGAAVDSAFEMRFAPRLVDGKPSVETGKMVTVKFDR